MNILILIVIVVAVSGFFAIQYFNLKNGKIQDEVSKSEDPEPVSEVQPASEIVTVPDGVIIAFRENTPRFSEKAEEPAPVVDEVQVEEKISNKPKRGRKPGSKTKKNVKKVTKPGKDKGDQLILS